MEEIWEIKAAKRIRLNPQNRQKQKKTQKRKNKETALTDLNVAKTGRVSLPQNLYNAIRY